MLSKITLLIGLLIMIQVIKTQNIEENQITTNEQTEFPQISNQSSNDAIIINDISNSTSIIINSSNPQNRTIIYQTDQFVQNFSISVDTNISIDSNIFQSQSFNQTYQQDSNQNQTIITILQQNSTIKDKDVNNNNQNQNYNQTKNQEQFTITINSSNIVNHSNQHNLAQQNSTIIEDISEDSTQTLQEKNITNSSNSSQQTATNQNPNLQTDVIQQGASQTTTNPFTAQKFYFHWLNNNGSILSFQQDWIKMIIATPQMKKSIICTDGKGYTYTPGTIRKFDNFWIPMVDYITITLVQYNFFVKDDAANIYDHVNLNEVGYYTTTISLSKFQPGVSLKFSYLGFGVTLNVTSYTNNADYYLLNELTSEIVPCCDQMSLPSSCSLSENIISQSYKIFFMIGLIAIMIIFH